MKILRKFAVAILMAFGLTLVAATPAVASAPHDKQGDIRVCKVLKDSKYLKHEQGFNFVVREKKGGNERDRYRFSIKIQKNEERDCRTFTVDKGAHVVREVDIPRGYKLQSIDVRHCYYKDRNDRDAKVEVDVRDKGRCTVIFTNKKDGR
jgi:hypothetical protein